MIMVQDADCRICMDLSVRKLVEASKLVGWNTEPDVERRIKMPNLRTLTGMVLVTLDEHR